MNAAGSDSGGRPAGSLGQRATRGAAWMFGLNVSYRSVGLVRTAILAHLLSPGQWGVFGIAVLFQSLLETITQLGMNAALTRMPGDPSPYYDTGWLLAALRGTVLAVAMVLAAPLVAGFFDHPEATPLIRVLAITNLIGGLNNPASVTLRRELRFRALYIINMLQTAADVGVSITAVYLYRTPMGLVLGFVARQVLGVGLNYAVVPWRPRFRFMATRAKELLSYGKWIMGSAILQFVYGQGDDIIVGRLLGAGDLGVYQMAYKYSNLPTTEVARVVHMVAMPAYAALQHDRVRLRGAFEQVLDATALVAIGLAAFIWAIAADFVPLVLGERWLAVVPVMAVLAVWGAVEAISELPIALFEAVGRPSIATGRLLVKVLFLAVAVWPMLSAWGLIGVAYAVLLSSLPALAWSLYSAARVVGLGARRLVVSLGVPLAGSCLAGMAAVVASAPAATGSLASLALATGAFLVTALALMLLAARIGYRVPHRFVRQLRRAVAR